MFTAPWILSEATSKNRKRWSFERLYHKGRSPSCCYSKAGNFLRAIAVRILVCSQKHRAARAFSKLSQSVKLCDIFIPQAIAAGLIGGPFPAGRIPKRFPYLGLAHPCIIGGRSGATPPEECRAESQTPAEAVLVISAAAPDQAQLFSFSKSKMKFL